jgi:hypothetical protein
MDPATLAATQAALQLRQQQHAGGEHDADDVSGGAGGGADGGASGGEGGLPLSELPEARRVASVLLRMPYTIPFDSRLRVLRRWLNDDREEREGMMLMGQLPFMITVRREHLLRDAHGVRSMTGGEVAKLHGYPPRVVAAYEAAASSGQLVAAVGDGFVINVVRDVLKTALRAVEAAEAPAVAEFLALLYDKSLDAIAEHQWPGAALLGLFRTEWDAADVAFTNGPNQFNGILGSWDEVLEAAEITYRELRDPFGPPQHGHIFFGGKGAGRIL